MRCCRFPGERWPGAKNHPIGAEGSLLFAGRSRRLRFFCLHEGRAKVTVVSTAGKEATITLPSAGDFVREVALAAMAGLRSATATAITACTALRISRTEMIHVMHEEHSFSDSPVSPRARGLQCPPSTR
ncbi:MAG TPA: cyclic nucleotide-binding domain-containing protein [Terracidiphilus sp.]